MVKCRNDSTHYDVFFAFYKQLIPILADVCV